jgi:hypothetical protein
MNTLISKIILTGITIVLTGFPGVIPATQHADKVEDFSGHYSRVGNNGSPSVASGNNIYIKFFSDRWIGMLFVPYPYASGIDPSTLTRVFEKAKQQTSSAAYIRGDFGELEELVTLQFERYGYLEDRIVFECGSLSPCTLKLGMDYLDLIKPGMINEHIIRYEHVTTE